MQQKQISVFKIRIDSIKAHAIGFELYAGERILDTYVNIVSKGGYGYHSRLILTPKQFSDFAIRLIAHTYLDAETRLGDIELTILWELRLNIFDHESRSLSKTIFEKEKDRLIKLGLMERKNNDK